MKRWKRTLSLLLCLALLCALVPQVTLFTSAATQSGTCGDNLTWELDTSTGVLTIAGTGAMDDWTYGTTPWFAYVGPISSVSIGDSVTRIGDYAFRDCTGLTSVTIPDGVTSIGNSAFYGCTGLATVTIGDGVESIDDCAFYGCSSLNDVYFFGTAAEWNGIAVGNYNECLTNAEIHYPSEPTEPTTAPTEPTTAPTEPTTAPTEPTTAPTEPTTAPTEPTGARYTVADSVNVGDRIVFAAYYNDKYYAMTNDNTTISNALTATEVTVSGDEVFIGEADVVWEVVAGETAGTYRLKNSDGKYINWTSSTSLKLSDTGVNFTPTLGKGTSSLTVTPTQSESTVRSLIFRDNGGAMQFRAYSNTNASQSGYSGVLTIYKYTKGTTPTEPTTAPTEPTSAPTEPTTAPTEGNALPFEDGDCVVIYNSANSVIIGYNEDSDYDSSTGSYICCNLTTEAATVSDTTLTASYNNAGTLYVNDNGDGTYCFIDQYDYDQSEDPSNPNVYYLAAEAPDTLYTAQATNAAFEVVSANGDYRGYLLRNVADNSYLAVENGVIVAKALVEGDLNFLFLFAIWDGTTDGDENIVCTIPGGAPAPTEPTEPTTAPTEPTTAPTEPTTAPTEPTTAPTEPTTAPTEPTGARYTVADSVNVGDRIVFAAYYNDKYYAMTNDNTTISNALTATEVTVSGDEVFIGEADVVWEVVAGTAEGSYLLKNSNANYISNKSGATTVMLDNTGTDFTIICGEGTSRIKVTSTLTQSPVRTLALRDNAALQFRAYSTSNIEAPGYSGVLTIFSDTHVHSWVAGTVVLPTCTTDGYTPYTCSLCGATKEDDVVPAPGHVWGAWTVSTPATCTTAGEQIRYCLVCNAIDPETVTIPATGHTYVNGVCAVCGAEQPDTVYYEKVTAAPNDWSGEYLLVYEHNAATAYVFNGLSTQNAYEEATITPFGIAYADEMATLTVAAMDGGYSIRVNGSVNDGKYIGGTADVNIMNFTDDGSLNTFAMGQDGVIITSDTSVLRWNDSESSGMLFRYYKTASYADQQPIQLYKLQSHEHVWVAGTTVAATCTGNGDTPYECSVCGKTVIEPILALGHLDVAPEDGLCDRCGASLPIRTGDVIAIVLASESKAVSTTAQTTYYGNGLAPVSVTVSNGMVDYQDTIAFIVQKDSDGAYQFVSGGRYLTAVNDSDSLVMDASATEFSSWYLEETDGGWNIRNKSARYGAELITQYLETFNNTFYVYGKYEDSTAQNYIFDFYPLTTSVDLSGDYYVAVNQTLGTNPGIWYMSAEGTANYRQADKQEGLTALPAAIGSDVNPNYVWTLTKNANTGAYTIHATNGTDQYIGWSSNLGNNAAYADAAEARALTITEENGVYSISFAVDASNTRYFSFNPASPRFAFYANTNQNTSIVLIPVVETHTATAVAAVPATCTEAGNSAYYYCAECANDENGEHYGKYYSDAAMETEIADVSIPALGHDLNDHVGQPATCTAAGWAAYQTCSRCDYSTYEAIPALGHDLADHAAQPATCTEIGWAAYQTCSRCDYSTYAEIPALGHDLADHAAQPATCTEIGWAAYQTCSRCDYSTYAEIPPLGHDLIDHAAQAVTCTEIGWAAYQTCNRCEYTTYEEIEALGHDFVKEVLIEPTCTQEGTAAPVCSRCALVLEEQTEPVAPLGHDLLLTSETAATCTEPGYSAGCVCTRCETVFVEPIVNAYALGHDLHYVNNGFNHSLVCSRCNYNEPGDHVFTDGICTACGAKEVSIDAAYPVLDENIDLVFVARVPSEAIDPYMVFTYHGETYTVREYTAKENGQFCCFFTQITPQCLGDTVSAVLHTQLNGSDMTDEVANYSVRQYCVNMLNNTEDAALKTLLSDLLTYGAAAQQYTNYKTNSLVTSGLDLTPSSFSTISGKSAAFAGTADAATDWIGAGLILGNDVTMRFTFAADSVADLTVNVSINGREEVFDADDFVSDGSGKYHVDFRGIEANEFDDAVTAAFYRNDAAVGRAVSYSVNAYVCKTQNSDNANLQALVRALYNYGVSAAAYAESSEG